MEPITLVISALLEKGGVWGVIAAAIISWNVFKEKKFLEKEKELKQKGLETDTKIDTVEKRYLEKISEMENTLQEMSKKLEMINEEKNKINEERIEDLKEAMNDYYKLASDTLNALEQIKFFLANKK
jgi:biopolymer transport protein ExbB/TolQ